MTGDPAYPRPAEDPTAGPAAAPPPPAATTAAPPDATAPPTDATAPPTDATAPPTDATAAPAGTAAPLPPQHTLDRTRTGGLWVAAISAVVVILLLLIFILQNDEQVEVSLFGANPDLPLGVALLLAAVLGALIVALLGTARVVQLRLTAKRHRTEDQSAGRTGRRTTRR